MLATRPRYLLIAESDPSLGERSWRFALHSSDNPWTVAASDVESGASDDRLELLAVVRGLEALDQPSEVTLVTRSEFVIKGIERGLADWRNNHWRWERFGRLVTVRHADLWRRIDQALRFHTVRCRNWNAEVPATTAAPTAATLANDAARAAAPQGSSAGATLDGVSNSPAMVIVPTPRARRTVRLAERAIDQRAAMAG
ncbi:MAG: RNase H family protein [Lacipirellulaceae bacterium]